MLYMVPGCANEKKVKLVMAPCELNSQILAQSPFHMKCKFTFEILSLGLLFPQLIKETWQAKVKLNKLKLLFLTISLKAFEYFIFAAKEKFARFPSFRMHERY